MKRWTIAHETFFCCGVACCSVIAAAMFVVGWPLVFVPWIWKGYTCWNEEEQ